jgi:uncharacterized protein YndB with AHSA1/START domain
MILKQRIEISCPPEKVWTFIEDPEGMQAWNPKVQAIDPISWGERHVGYRYRITYVMRNKASEFLAEIIEYRKPQKLVIRLTEGKLPPNSHVSEIYELSQTAEGTLLEQRIEVHNSGMNIFIRLLIGFILRFGKPMGKRYLEKLKELVEAAA